MIRHIVMWKFRPGTEAEQAQFLEGLRGLQGVIPELLKSEVAVHVGEDNYDAVLVSEFESLELTEEALACRIGGVRAGALARSMAEGRSSMELMDAARILGKALEYTRSNVSPAAVCGWLQWALR